MLEVVVIACLPFGSLPAEESPPEKLPAQKSSADGGPITAETVLRRLSERAKSATALRVEFRQEKRLRILRRPRITRGEIRYSRQRLAMIVRSPSGDVQSHLVLRDGKLSIHYPSVQRLETLDLKDDSSGAGGGEGDGEGPPPILAFFTGDVAALKRDYKLRLETTGAAASEGSPLPAGAVTLVFTAKRAQATIETIRLVVLEDRVHRYEQTDAKGDRVRLDVERWETDRPLPPGAFELNVPEGTKLVRIAP